MNFGLRSLAGWPTQSTMRHLNVCSTWINENIFLKRGVPQCISNGDGLVIDLDPHKWYTIADVLDLVKEKRNALVQS